MKRIIIFLILLLILVSGCNIYREMYGTETPIERYVGNCSQCNGTMEECWFKDVNDGRGSLPICKTFQSYCSFEGLSTHEIKKYFEKKCDCFSEQNESYSFFMNVSSGKDPFINFVDKRNLAMTDDKWVCYCADKYELQHYEYPIFSVFDCKELDDPSYVKNYKENITENTEFIWKY